MPPTIGNSLLKGAIQNPESDLQGMIRSQSTRLACVQLSALRRSRVSEQTTSWFPDEPLAGFSSLSSFIPTWQIDNLNKCDDTKSFLSIQKECHRINIENFKKKIEQILTFCSKWNVDVVVLPEYALPPELLDTVKKFSERMLIIAGVGFIRNADIPYFAQSGFSPTPKKGNNVAIACGPGISQVIIKKHAAEGETIVAGDGIALLETLGHHKYAVAICRDFIVDGSSLSGADHRPSIVAIPALTPSIDAFHDDAPRDFVRILSNHADLGGSSIQVPNAIFPAFVDKRGTVPLQRNEEAIVILDFDGYPTKPTSLKKTQNRLVCRSAILYESASEGLREALESVSHFHSPDAKLETFIEIVGSIDKKELANHTVLSDALSAILENGDELLEQEIAALTDHLVLKDVLSDKEVRYLQLGLVESRLRELSASDPADWAAPLSEYSNAMRALAPDARTEILTPRHSNVAPIARSAGEPPRETVFSATVGSFSSDSAASSLPRQLSMLRAFSEIASLGIELSYIVHTELSASGDRKAVFTVYSTAPKELNVEAVEGLREGFGQLLSSTFGGSYSIRYGTKPYSRLLPFTVAIELDDADIEEIQFSSGWTSVIDYLRSIAIDTKLELLCGASKPGAPSPRVIADAADCPGLTDEASVAAQSYLKTQFVDANAASKKLNLSVLLSSEQQLDDIVIWSVIRQMFATSRVKGIPYNAKYSRGLNLIPEDLLRVFHTPFGSLYGGRSHRTSDIFLPDIRIPQTGIILGDSKVRHMRTDQSVRIRLDAQDRFRHIYVVGKTGTGKTNLLKSMAQQDLSEGLASVVVIDPHGDLIDFLLPHIPTNRLDKVVLLDFGDPSSTPSFNPLLFESGDEAERSIVIDEIIDALSAKVFHQWTGPVFEDSVRLALETVCDSQYWLSHPSILDAPQLLRSRTSVRALKEWFANSNPDLSERWGQFDRWFDSNDFNTAYVTSKFSDLVSGDFMRAVLSTGGPQISLGEILQDGRTLLVRLPQTTIGKRAASFIGSLILSKLQRAIFMRGVSAGAVPVYIYVDEFQNFATAGFEELIAEARKFRVGLTLANQNLHQLEQFSAFKGTSTAELREALLGNVGSLIVTGVSSRDARELNQELGLAHDSDALTRIGRWEAVARVLVSGRDSGPFTLRPPEAIASGGDRSRRVLQRHLRQAGLDGSRQVLVAKAQLREDNLGFFLKSDQARRVIQFLIEELAFDDLRLEGAVSTLAAADRSLKALKKRDTSIVEVPKILALGEKLRGEEGDVAILELLYSFAVNKLKKSESKAAFRLVEKLAVYARERIGFGAELLIWDIYTHKAAEDAGRMAVQRKTVAARKLR